MNNAIRTTLLAVMLLLGAAGTASAADGGWSFEPIAGGGYEATWTSPDPLPLSSDRPEILLDGSPAGPAAISADGRSVTATLPGDRPPAADRLEVRLSGRSLDRPGTEAIAPAGSPWIAPAGQLPDLGFDPGVKGPHAVTGDNYTGTPWEYPGMRRKLEMKGHVVAPADPAVAAGGPLVLFLHGRHSTCYRPGPRPRATSGWPCRKGMKPIPSDRGYDYLQRILASQGFVTVSVAANGINAQDDVKPDGGAGARAALVRRHLGFWADQVGSGDREADLGRTILIGHSRGGEGVNRAAELIPLAAPYRIAGQVLLAPTNFARQSAAYVPTVTVLPYCDGDVSDLQGQAYTDNSIGLASGDSSLKSSVTMFGANHNFFNTEWTPGVAKAPSSDDSWAPPRSLCGSRSKTRLGAAQQRRVARSYVAGAVQLMTGTDDRNLKLFDGTAVRVGPVTRAAVISQSVGAGKVTLVAGRNAKPAADGLPGVSTCLGYAGGGRRDCARHVNSELTPHWPPTWPRGLPGRPALAMSWKKPGRTARLELDRELDLTGMSGLDLRVVTDPSTRTARLGVALTDADGHTTSLAPAAGGRVNAMPSGRGTPGRWLARTLRMPVPAGDPGTFDPTRVTTVRLRGEGKPDCGEGCPAISRVRVLDISARPDVPSLTPPVDRLPLVRLKAVTQPEGGPGKRTAEVPYTVSGTVADPGTRFRVVAYGDTGDIRPVTVRLAPGQTSGSVAIPYRGDRIYDRGRTINVEAYPIRGAIPATSAVMVRLRNDDPRPRVRVAVARKWIPAGETARWRVSLTRGLGWPAVVDARFASVPGLPQLRIGDLSAGWLERHTYGGDVALPDRTPLARTGIWISGGLLRPGKPLVIEVPTQLISGGPARRTRLRLYVLGLGETLTPPVRVIPR